MRLSAVITDLASADAPPSSPGRADRAALARSRSRPVLAQQDCTTTRPMRAVLAAGVVRRALNRDCTDPGARDTGGRRALHGGGLFARRAALGRLQVPAVTDPVNAHSPAPRCGQALAGSGRPPIVSLTRIRGHQGQAFGQSGRLPSPSQCRQARRELRARKCLPGERWQLRVTKSTAHSLLEGPQRDVTTRGDAAFDSFEGEARVSDGDKTAQLRQDP
jgi:hypothetical protein